MKSKCDQKIECSKKLQELVNLAKLLDKRLIYKSQLHFNIKAINIKNNYKNNIKISFLKYQIHKNILKSD